MYFGGNIKLTQWITIMFHDLNGKWKCNYNTVNHAQWNPFCMNTTDQWSKTLGSPTDTHTHTHTHKHTHTHTHTHKKYKMGIKCNYTKPSHFKYIHKTYVKSDYELHHICLSTCQTTQNKMASANWNFYHFYIKCFYHSLQRTFELGLKSHRNNRHWTWRSTYFYVMAFIMKAVFSVRYKTKQNYRVLLFLLNW